MRNLLFISGSRADYNKICKIIKFLSKNNKVTILLVDMHNDSRFGMTKNIVIKDNKDIENINVLDVGKKDTTDTIKYFAWLIKKLELFFKNNTFDMVFVHGDRMSAMAGAIVASYNNIPVCQIEAGDVSGSIDQNIRYAITKFAHRFLVTNKDAEKRVLQSGESEDSVYNIGNTSIINIDKDESASYEKNLFGLGDNYAVLMYHPVTTESFDSIENNFLHIVSSLQCFNGKVLLIQSNNDRYYKAIQKTYETLDKEKFVIERNIDPKYFYKLIMGAKFLIGNSSAGICEAPYLGTYSIDIGTRQSGRKYKEKSDTIFHLDELSPKLEETITKILEFPKPQTAIRTTEEFEKILENVFTDDFFNISIQKKFIMR